MERLDGPDLLTRLGKRPWTVAGAGRLLGRLHAGLHEVEAPPELPDVKDNVRLLLELRGDLVPTELAAEAHGLLEDMPDGNRICHGDYHPANLLLTAGGPRVIDWASASRGDPLADVCRTHLLIELAEVPDLAPWLLRRLDRVGRSLLLRSYLRAYGRSAWDLVVWRRVLLIARLAEDVEAERPKLLELLEGPA
jgi:aminoglycoside phosphotransferase (APT) family kinase protein